MIGDFMEFLEREHQIVFTTKKQKEIKLQHFHPLTHAEKNIIYLHPTIQDITVGLTRHNGFAK